MRSTQLPNLDGYFASPAEAPMKRQTPGHPHVWTLPLVALICLLFAQTKANAVPVAVDTALTFASGESEAGMTPDITGAAYTNNFKGATTSTLYAIDWRRGQLQRIGSPNGSPISSGTGQVFTVGTLGTGFQITEMV